ncbi:hypothetical protein ACQ4PT_041538 [Festuca glaucescens]
MGILRDVAGGLGNFFAGILIAAPLITMYQIWRDDSVGQRWVVNYVATFVNAVCMVAYALPSKRTHVRQNQNILLLLAALGNCVSWTLFSIKPRDLYIQVPNGAGIGLTVLQTLVWVVIWRMYRNAVPQQPPANNRQANQNQVNIELPSPA